MKRLSALLTVLAFAALASVEARAATIFDFSGSLAAANPTELGRLSRNAIAQDWGGSELFPGVINTTTAYHYRTFSINVGNTPYVQIDMDSLSANTFIAAYDSSYLPNSGPSPNLGFDTHWLGDAGSSGNFFGTDPIFFQVYVPANHNLIVVVNQTAAGTVGLGDAFHLTVEGFVDSQFTDPPGIPEPSTVVLALGVLFALFFAHRDSPNRITSPSPCSSKGRRPFSLTTRYR